MEILIMVKCDANGNYIHPNMLRLEMNKCLASKKSSEHSPSNVGFV